MAKQKTEYERRSVQLNISISPYIKEQLQRLVDEGYFSNISDAVRWAISKMIAEFEAQGKLRKPPEDAQERIKNATLIEENEIEFE